MSVILRRNIMKKNLKKGITFQDVAQYNTHLKQSIVAQLYIILIKDVVLSAMNIVLHD